MEVIGASSLPVTDPSHVAEVRRLARQAATRLGFDETAVARVALVATELATNLVRHARGGEIILLAPVGPCAALEIVALDRGPGMSNVSRCFEDGFSTAGSPGTGLGAVGRLSDRHDAYSRLGLGTVLCAAVDGPRRAPQPVGPLEIAAISTPMRQEAVCGDAWSAEHHVDGAAIMVVDGLGHGSPAAEAASAAVGCFDQYPSTPPAERLEMIHAALRPTRGAAGAIAEVNVRSGVVSFAGVGNVSAVIHAPDSVRHLVSLNGILGHSVRKINAYQYPWPSGSVLIAYTDGLATMRTLDAYPGLTERSPLVIAGVLYRDLVRGRDDATVVVARERRP